MKTSFLILGLLALFLIGCQANPATPPTAISIPTTYPTYTPYPTLKPYPTYTFYPTYTAVPQREITVMVTATLMPTPLYTPTETQVPSKTPIPSPTLDPLQMAKSPGLYLVNIDIAPGIWRNNGTSDKFYWKRSTKTGDIIDNFYGMGGATMYVAPIDFEVELEENCGAWTYLGPL